jgi:hypothetical protein
MMTISVVAAAAVAETRKQKSLLLLLLKSLYYPESCRDYWIPRVQLMGTRLSMIS